MGWNTYFAVGQPTEETVKDVADHLVSSGLKKSGYDIVWLDGGWQADTPRDAQGRLVAHPDRFPSGIPALVDYLHKRGLKAGIYTDAGTYDGGETCGLGSRGHYDQDARQFAGWKFDAIKVDFLCGITEKADPEPAFKEFSEAVRKAGRPMILNLCNPLTDDWGIPHTPAQDAKNNYRFGPRYGDSWRTGTDVAFGTPSENQWPNILRNLDANMAHPEAQSPGRYNDPDYLIPMRRMEDGSRELTEEESTTQLVMWSVMASPLVIGADPRTLPQSMIDTLRNPEILGVDQDPLAIQGAKVASDDTGDVYSKVLQGTGKRAVVLLNRSDDDAERTVRFSDAGLDGPVRVRDLRARADKGTHRDTYTVRVPAHGTAFLKLSGEDSAPGTALGARSSQDPAAVRTADGRTDLFVRDKAGSVRRHTVRDGQRAGDGESLGTPPGGRVTGRPAARATRDGDVEVYVRAADGRGYRKVLSGDRQGAWQRVDDRRLGSALAAAGTGTGGQDTTVVARGTDGDLLAKSGPDANWTDLGTPEGHGLYDDPAAVADAQGRVHVVVRGTDSALWTRVKDANGSWSQWSSLGGSVGGSPSLALDGDTVRLYARAGDYTVWQRSLPGTSDGDGTEWTDWSKRADFPSAATQGSLAAAGGDDVSLVAAYRGVGDRLRLTALSD
ncbi:glycoside hydrolase family 27 protein [Streptomyces triticagri]|uniref:Alpha-galactosidase n=2 Tax=Streptomyces triticagri TaxID=2293568 RepID=A0A372LVG7_9ACTN|nr:glycoside hydrolase family 27 protein [Streptomyces triticagri]